MRKLQFLVLSIVFLSCHLATAQKYPDVLKQIEASGNFAPLFPFQPTHNAPDNITNVRTWTGVSNGVAGATGFISPEGDHFVDGDGNEIRFMGRKEQPNHTSWHLQ